MKRLLGIIVTGALLGMVASQVQFVNAKAKEDQTNRLTSPLTSPCKPGWGYGDKNHCHGGPPGLMKQENASTAAKKAGK